MRRFGVVKYGRVVLLCALMGAFLLMSLLVGCKADGGAETGALPVATYTGTDIRGKTAREINEASTLPLPLLASIDAFEPAGYESLSGFASKTYQREGHILRFAGFPTDEDPYFLTEISWMGKDFDLFGIKVGDYQAEAAETLRAQGFISTNAGLEIEFKKNGITVNLEAEDWKAENLVIERIGITTPSEYTSGRLY
jgi:hypothetical protein